MDRNTLSKNIVSLRKARGLTQKQLAAKINYSDKVISKWERDESLPDIVAIASLARFFDVSVDQLIGSGEKNGIDKSDENVDKIDLKHVQKPSRILVWSIFPFIVVWVYTIFLGPLVFAFACFIFGIVLFTYGVLLSYHTWATVYRGHDIVVQNKPTSFTLWVDGVMEDRSNALIKSGLKLQTDLGEKRISVYLTNLIKAKCEIVIT